MKRDRAFHGLTGRRTRQNPRHRLPDRSRGLPTLSLCAGSVMPTGRHCPSFISVLAGPATRWLVESVQMRGWPRMWCRKCS